MQPDFILKRPIITEKTMKLASQQVYTFEVDPQAAKAAIAAMVEKQFKVEVVSLATSVLKGKTKRFGKKRHPKQFLDRKKAMVEVKKGQKIDLFDIDPKGEKK